MRWRVTYSLYYPDMVRGGVTDCVSREDAFSWIVHAKTARNFLEVVVWCGPKFIHRWNMTEEYEVRGTRYRWFVYKPSTGTKFYVRKKSLANDKTIGNDKSFASLDAAKRAADREAGYDQKGFV